MTDLDTLRPEVREALHRINRNFHISADYETIRAELLRLARENDEWQTRCLQFQTERDHARQMHADRDVDVQHEWARAEAAEAELAAMKARIADAPRVYHSSFEYTLDASTLYARAVGIPGEEMYALVKMEE